MAPMTPPGRRTPVPFVCALAAAMLAAVGAAPSLSHERSTDLLAAARLPLEGGTCRGGDPIAPTLVIAGSFSHDLQGAYVMVPFDVPAGTTSVRVKYCWDAPENAPADGSSHTIDLGLWQARTPGESWGTAEFRGWGGSSHPDVTVTPQGFSSEAEYLARPEGHVPGRTTRGFLPGPIPSGEWAAELGVAAVVPADEGDRDGRVSWRLEIELSSDPAFAADGYRAAHYDTRPAIRKPGWYAGDMHVHAEHSALGDATMTEVFDYAFRPLDEGGAGLDFLTLSDYVTSSGWGEVGRYQAEHPGKLVVRSSEIITYTGHTNNHASLTYVDHRTGPVYERRQDGSVFLLRGATPARDRFVVVRRHGGFTQINHPTIFPSSSPSSQRLCRGCPWDFSAEATDYSLVDAIEIQTGPAAFGASPNPFTLTAIEFWEDALDAGHKIAAVGSSDSHHAGQTQSATQSPIGQATTVVFARELSERGVRDAVRAGHTYVKLLGNDGPDLRLEARSPAGRRAIMGDTLAASTASLTARVLNVADADLVLLVVEDGIVVDSVPVRGSEFEHRFRGTAPHRYRLQLERGDLVVGVTSPIYLEAPAGPGHRRPLPTRRVFRSPAG
jgi:hypothetical protein